MKSLSNLVDLEGRLDWISRRRPCQALEDILVGGILSKTRVRVEEDISLILKGGEIAESTTERLGVGA